MFMTSFMVIVSGFLSLFLAGWGLAVLHGLQDLNSPNWDQIQGLGNENTAS